MSSQLGQQVARDPFMLISILVGAIVLTNLVTNLFPTLIANIVTLGSLGNFTFSTLFADDGLGEIIASVVVLVAILAILGVKSKGGSRR